MTDDRSLERAARSWLEEGPTRPSDRPVDAALARIQAIPQDRDHRIPWRFPTMTPLVRLAGAAVFALAAAATALVVMRPAPTAGPVAPTVVSTPMTVPPSPTAPRSPIADGTYAADLPVAEILAKLDSDTTLNAEQKQSIIEEILDISGATTLHLQVVVADGQFTLRQGKNGSALFSNKPWRMTVIDDHTIEFNAVNGPVNARNEVVPGTIPGSFTLRPVSGAGDPVPAFVNRILFESRPFVPTT